VVNTSRNNQITMAPAKPATKKGEAYDAIRYIKNTLGLLERCCACADVCAPMQSTTAGGHYCWTLPFLNSEFAILRLLTGPVVP
jgi:hypothetical protein